jgi:hypothetical protein
MDLIAACENGFENRACGNAIRFPSRACDTKLSHNLVSADEVEQSWTRLRL